jgi:hypothetical protein
LDLAFCLVCLGSRLDDSSFCLSVALVIRILTVINEYWVTFSFCINLLLSSGRRPGTRPRLPWIGERLLTRLTCFYVKDFIIEGKSFIIFTITEFSVLNLCKRVETIMISGVLSVIFHLVFAPGFIQLSQAQNLQLGQWQQINYRATTAISGRLGHSAAFLSSTNEYLVVSGWMSSSLSDFHSINIASLQSTQLAASSPLGRRYGMAYTSDSNSNFYVHGGWNGSGMLITFEMSSFLMTTDLNSGLE